MSLREQVLVDPHATPEFRYRGFVRDSEFGMTDAAAAAPGEALERARRRWRLRWLGVEWPGLVRPACAASPEAGQIALDRYRLALWRRIGLADRCICWIMLNPSTADHRADDATLRRIRRYSLDWGFGWLTVGNLWPYRATQPVELAAWLKESPCVADRVSENDIYVASMADRAERIVVAWGAAGRWQGRSARMLALLASHDVHALAITRDGEPRHPLRLDATLQPWPLAALRDERRVA